MTLRGPFASHDLSPHLNRSPIARYSGVTAPLLRVTYAMVRVRSSSATAKLLWADLRHNDNDRTPTERKMELSLRSLKVLHANPDARSNVSNREGNMTVLWL